MGLVWCFLWSSLFCPCIFSSTFGVWHRHATSVARVGVCVLRGLYDDSRTRWSCRSFPTLWFSSQWCLLISSQWCLLISEDLILWPYWCPSTIASAFAMSMYAWGGEGSSVFFPAVEVTWFPRFALCLTDIISPWDRGECKRSQVRVDSPAILLSAVHKSWKVCFEWERIPT